MARHRFGFLSWCCSADISPVFPADRQVSGHRKAVPGLPALPRCVPPSSSTPSPKLSAPCFFAMNKHIVCKLLGRVALLIGVTMLFSLPWAFPALWGKRHTVGAAEPCGVRVGGILFAAGEHACLRRPLAWHCFGGPRRQRATISQRSDGRCRTQFGCWPPSWEHCHSI